MAEEVAAFFGRKWGAHRPADRVNILDFVLRHEASPLHITPEEMQQMRTGVCVCVCVCVCACVCVCTCMCVCV